MKPLLKRLSSMFLALVMIVSITPATGALLADETETAAPEVTEASEPEKSKETKKPAAETTKETKKPAEETTKETEAPAETTKETEAPAESEKETEAPATEAPAETEKETEAPATEAPAETEKETEAPVTEEPKETEAPATEAPAETEKETEAPVTEEPKETEAPAEEIPEETQKPEAKKRAPDASASQNPKKVGTVDASIDANGNLMWNEYSGANCYTIQISEASADYDYEEYGTTFNLKNEIEDLIRYGYLERKSPYTIVLSAYKVEDDDDNDDTEESDILLATWKTSFEYEAKIKPSGLGKIKEHIKNGVLTWDKYKGASFYWLFLDDYIYEFYGKPGKFHLNDQIDWMISYGDLEKAASYRIRIVAFGKNGKIIADKVWDYEYSSSATHQGMGSVTGMSVSKGILTWNEVENADDYEVYIEDIDYWTWSADKNSMDINDFIDEMISEGEVPKKSSYKVTVCAITWCPEGEESRTMAEGSFTYNFEVAPNPMAIKGKTATVKYKKLKKKKQTLSVSKVLNGLGTARGSMTFTKVSGNGKISINKSTGKVTIKKKGLKKGKTYSVKVKIKAAGNYGYDPSEEQIVTFKIKVKK